MKIEVKDIKKSSFPITSLLTGILVLSLLVASLVLNFYQFKIISLLTE